MPFNIQTSVLTVSLMKPDLFRLWVSFMDARNVKRCILEQALPEHWQIEQLLNVMFALHSCMLCKNPPGCQYSVFYGGNFLKKYPRQGLIKCWEAGMAQCSLALFFRHNGDFLDFDTF